MLWSNREDLDAKQAIQSNTMTLLYDQNNIDENNQNLIVVELS